MTVSRSYYEILGVDQTADLQTLKKAFHRLSKALHPDTTLLPIEDAAKKFRQVCEAYKLLSDPISRYAYDKSLKKETLTNYSYIKQSDFAGKVPHKTVSNIDNRRPLSGGELFSLLLLCIALCISLLLGIGFAVLDGRELQVNPSWLNSNQLFVDDSPNVNTDESFTSS